MPTSRRWLEVGGRGIEKFDKKKARSKATAQTNDFMTPHAHEVLMHNPRPWLPILASTASLRAGRCAGCCAGADRRAGFAARHPARRAGCCGHGGTARSAGCRAARRAGRRAVRLSLQGQCT